MWDRFVNFVTQEIRGMSFTAFCILVGVVITLGFLFLANFLKANKKEAPKLSKISQLLMSILMIVLFVILTRIRN